MFIWSAEIASATRKPPARRIARPGRRITRLVSAVQKRDSPAGRRLTGRTRPFSTRSPSHDSIAGRIVGSTAIAATRIVPSAKEMNALSPLMNMPAIATITVTPEISTARPDVAAAASSAALAASGGSLLALTPEVEERVVHPTASPISRTTAGRLLSAGKRWLVIATRPRAAMTDVSPIRSGRPAATSVPKVMMRMISVASEASPPS